MKNFLLLSFLLLLCYNLAEAQTNANIPGPENVLVVYRTPVDESDTLSKAIMEYYVNVRGIPFPQNTLGLRFPSKPISVGDWSDPHIVKLGFDNQNILDSTWEKWDTTHCVDTAKFHAYQYFLEEVANPIRLHIQENNLGSIIRYLVICQGVPYKIQAAGDWSVPGNINVDGLLAMLNTPNYDEFVEAIFNNYTTQCYAGCDSTYPACYSSPFISNPYYNKDPYFEMNSRFLPDYYSGNWAGYNYKLSYLVSRLDGLSFEIIKDMIDRSVAADVTGEKTWILDGGGPGSDYILDANNKLTNLDFNTEYNSSKNNWITTSPDKVIGYTSAGVHQGMPTRYIQDILNFNYANGAIFNTYESYNGYSIGTLRRRGDQGLMTEFTLTGGTGGTGNSWEPYEADVVHSGIYFSSYAVGYTQIDAAWLGMPMLAWRNVVVGDPLTRIYNYSQITLASDSTITGGDIFEGIVVPEGKTLTIAGNAQLNFKRNSSLRVFGTVIINNNSNVSFDSFSELRINAGGKIIINQYANVEFNNYSRLNIHNNGQLISGSYSDIVFNDQTSYSNNGLHTLNLYSEAAFNGSSSMIVKGKMCINEACNLYFNNQRERAINGSLICIGSLNKEVNMFFGGNSKSLDFQNGDTLQLKYTKFNGGSLSVGTDTNNTKMVSIENSSFLNSPKDGIIISVEYALSDNVSASIRNSTFESFSFNGIKSIGLKNLIISNCTLSSINNNSVGIFLAQNSNTIIQNCSISSGNGIISDVTQSAEEEIANVSIDESIDILSCQINFSSEFEVSSGNGIYLNNTGNGIVSLNIENCSIEGFSNNIYFQNFKYLIPLINNSSLNNFKVNGITALNGNGIIVSNCSLVSSIASSKRGLFLSNIKNPLILDNTIRVSSTVSSPEAGIQMVSSNGAIRRNQISGFLYGIELGGSSPDLAQNIITGNKSCGLYVSSYSMPDMSRAVIDEDIYPITGYNNIYENGICDLSYSNAEIFLYRSSINMESGCNTIADDRDSPYLNCVFTFLIDGQAVLSDINAQKNYWGNHPACGHNPELRFGDEVTVDYDGYLDEPCENSVGGSLLLLSNVSPFFVDSVYSTGPIIESLSEFESKISLADKQYYSNNFSTAKNLYKEIIELFSNISKSSVAYNKLFTLEWRDSLNGMNFEQLKNYYQSRLELLNDSILIGAVSHLNDMCLVADSEYIAAIERFDELVYNNQDNDISFYNAINALTTALLIEDNALLKGVSAKYKTADNSDFITKLNILTNKRNGNINIDEPGTIPDSYMLYNNYPNPFNPSTTIKYDMPVSLNPYQGETLQKVVLKVYDILGKEVVTLVDEEKPAGRYEVNFDASKLASGVYIYQIKAGDFISSKKMLLLK